MEKDTIPLLVFHYCSLDIAYKILNECRLKLSSPMNVNDDLEFTYNGYKNVDAAKVREVLYTEYYYKIAKEQSCINKSLTKTYEDWRRYIDSLSNNCIQEIANNLLNGKAYDVKHFQRIASTMMGFICFSECSMLTSMFERYANNQQGVAIGFDTQYLTDLEKVKYVHELPPKPFITVCTENDYADIKELLHTKSIKNEDWSVEKEWRIVCQLSSCVKSGNSYYKSFASQAIRKIIFGSKTPITEKRQFMIFCCDRFPNIEFCDAFVRQD